MTKHHVTVKHVNWLVVLAFIVLALIASTLMAGAYGSGQPANGNYAGGLDGWTVSGGHGGFDSLRDWSGDGSGSAHIWRADSTLNSSKVTMTGIWELHLSCFATGTANGMVGIVPWGSAPGAMTPLACADTWSDRIVQGMGNGDWQIIFGASDDDTTWDLGAYFDNVNAVLTGGTATPTAPYYTPTAVPTMTPVSASNVSAGVATPYFRSSNVSGVIPYMQAGSGTLADVSKVSVDTRDISFCLPSNITQFISDVDLCYGIPAFEMTEWNILGVNILPYAAIVGVGLFIVFIIRQLQEH